MVSPCAYITWAVAAAVVVAAAAVAIAVVESIAVAEEEIVEAVVVADIAFVEEVYFGSFGLTPFVAENSVLGNLAVVVEMLDD